ncbi:MAG: hypothetical protein M1608_15390 [Candidatus Omnitrophica bacterium]|nr:hypothetical protein [Candidatus Omnitrophota bacterium]
MTRSGSRLFKPVLAALAVVLLLVASFSQQRLNSARDRLGLTRIEPLKNAPPVLAFTTVALGGFRGLIANALWIRAMDLQDDGKYFEMAQLADWITTLQPHMTTVWIVQAWNMAYNISIKFQDPRDRWFWVRQGIELLRDRGLKYNPHEPLIYRELAWFFQHKMGQNLDDAHMYFKEAWAELMDKVLGGGRPNYDALLHPKTDQDKSRLKQLEDTYKMDPKVMEQVDEHYGPLDWRLPEASAIYWAWLGLAECKKREDLIPLRRVIYQSMQLAFQRGQLLESKTGSLFQLGPNLDLIPNANRAYEDMMEQDPKEHEQIQTGHRNFLRDAVYFLYVNNRLSEAAKWFHYLGEKYPNKPLLNGKPNTLPGTISIDDYALDRISEDVGETSQDRVRAIVGGLLVHSFVNRAMGLDDTADNYELLASKVYARFEKAVEGAEKRVGLAPLAQIRKEALDQLLGTDSPLNQELQAQLRTALRLPAPTLPPTGSTNTPATPAATNTPAASAGAH